jgi:dTDP-4-dehydrorhamnose reductase
MKILVTGAGGLVGRALVGRGALGASRAAIDVTRADDLERALTRFSPDAVIFCAAVTNVDACETDQRAWATNALAPAAWARRVPTWLVSTNYVFDGAGPHAPRAGRSPVNAYGRQKLAAEDGVLAAGGHVVRTGWVFGPGGRNFPSTIFDRVRGGAVHAMTGWPVQPTWVGDLAERLLTLPEGVSHAIGGEQTTWFRFALEAERLLGLGGRVHPQDALPTGPRPSDARLAPADLPGWRARLPLLLEG